MKTDMEFTKNMMNIPKKNKKTNKEILRKL